MGIISGAMRADSTAGQLYVVAPSGSYENARLCLVPSKAGSMECQVRIESSFILVGIGGAIRVGLGSQNKVAYRMSHHFLPHGQRHKLLSIVHQQPGADKGRDDGVVASSHLDAFALAVPPDGVEEGHLEKGPLGERSSHVGPAKGVRSTAPVTLGRGPLAQ